jgi:hypothetical protein
MPAATTPPPPRPATAHARATTSAFPTHSTGDVLARFQQRAAEIEACLAVLDTLLRTVTPGHRVGAQPPYYPAGG